MPMGIKMKIAVLSGKGGTGKTFVSVNLAAASSNAVYIDCDVEEPNGHLFFKPQNLTTQSVSVMIPAVEQNKCNSCRKCVEFCKFNALAFISGKVMVFDDVCHSCGGCSLLCLRRQYLKRKNLSGKLKRGFLKMLK